MLVFVRNFIVAAATISLTACGGNDSPSETTPPKSNVEAAPTEVSSEAPETTPPAAPAKTVEASPEFADLPEPYKSASYSRGKRTYRTCSSCHLLDPDAGNLVGPNLHGMFDRKAGELEGYNFSKVLQEADFQWTAEELDSWLANPNSYLPGNNMSFTGVQREKDRDAVIAYLLIESRK